MKTLEERRAILSTDLSFLGELSDRGYQPKPTICSPTVDLSYLGYEKVLWAPYVWIGKDPLPKDHKLFENGKIFTIGLASVLTCIQLVTQSPTKILDMCAAPGIKTAYLKLILGDQVEIYANDLSRSRLLRLKRLHDHLGIPMPRITCKPGERLANIYGNSTFDAVLIDAPCSGEGKILAGDTKTLGTWSPAKVKRLSILQRNLLRIGLRIVTQDGLLIYSTCTLNKIENDRVVSRHIKGIKELSISPNQMTNIGENEAIRILPSENSIGFFVARLKSSTIGNNYE